MRFLSEGEALVEGDPVQACERLYRAAEEVVKALAMHYNLDVLKRVRDKGGWSVVELEKAVLQISGRVGRWFREAWDAAWVLHVWGFHEARFDGEDVRERGPYVRRMVEEAWRVVKG